MDIQFYYKNNKPCVRREDIISRLANTISDIIELPDSIEVCVYPLDKNVYGGIDKYCINRLALNFNLDYNSIPVILTHELIHVSQKYTKMLEIKNNGHYYWYGIPYTKVLPEEMSYEEYRNLPWEVDVQNRETKVLQMALELIVSKG